MGRGIGIVGARVAGLDSVVFVDPSEKSLKIAESTIDAWCDKEISKERMTETEKDSMLKRISYGDTLKHLSDVDFVVEAASEDFVIKKAIFQHLQSNTKDSAILATNTSSISITKIAGCVPERAHQVIGMHFMNPVPVMKLVEIINGL